MLWSSRDQNLVVKVCRTLIIEVFGWLQGPYINIAFGPYSAVFISCYCIVFVVIYTMYDYAKQVNPVRI